MLPIIDKIKLEESSNLSGTLPDGTAVRILYPLEGSSCSCHSKELGAHKSAVILVRQIQEKLVSAEDFQEKAQQSSAKEADAIRECAIQNLQLLHEVFNGDWCGCLKTSPDHLEAERFGVIPSKWQMWNCSVNWAVCWKVQEEDEAVFSSAYIFEGIFRSVPAFINFDRRIHLRGNFGSVPQ